MTAFSRRAVLGAFGAVLLASCSSTGTGTGGGANGTGVGDLPGAPTGAVTSQPMPDAIGQGQVKAALILPASASGGAAAVAQSMRNAAEMALAEFNNPNVQLIVKDDGGTQQGASQAAQAAIGEGAEIVLGPLFAHTTASAAQVARQSNVPMIAFSTDASVATRGVYLLSFLPQSDVNRIVAHAAQNGRKSFAALLPDDAYGSVVEGAFQEAVAKHGGRVVALERYPAASGQIQTAVSRVAQAARQVDAIFLPDAGDAAPAIVAALVKSGVDLKRVMLLGTGLWDDPRIANAPALAGGLFAAPDQASYQAFAGRYRARYGQDPVRTATLAYDAVLLAAALTQTQGSQRFSEAVLTNASGFQGIDGIFRFRTDGANERGLAVLQVEPGGARVVAPAPKSFSGGNSGF